MNIKELVGQVGWQDGKVFMYMYVAEDAYVCAHLLQQHVSFMLKDYIIHEFYVIFLFLHIQMDMMSPGNSAGYSSL